MVEWSTGMTLNPCENASLMALRDYDSSQNLYQPCVVSHAILITCRTTEPSKTLKLGGAFNVYLLSVAS